MKRDRLTELLGSPEMAVRFIQLFKSQVPEQLAQLQQAADGDDWATVNVIAHTLKGQLAYLDENDLQKMAYQLEQKAENGQANRGEVAGFIADLELLMSGL
jgi:HPt (histidine-containing phosphotransfer) domain-containing protein